MKMILKIIMISLALTVYFVFPQEKEKPEKAKEDKMDYKVKKSENEWKQELTEEQYRVLRQKGTEAPFTGEYNDFDEIGIYSCAACGAEVFRSDAKFTSSCGWPSFFEPVTSESLVEKTDLSHNMKRTEILCGTCGSHLGHVFEDGPKPTGLRYCINSAALNFKPDKER
jgi:peptide-methionine (R)-S-oxide reductase